MDHLDRFTHFTAGITYFFAFVSFTAFLIVVLSKGFRQNSNKRTISGQIDSALVFYWLILSLISLLYSNIKTNKRFPCTGNSCYKAYAFILIFLTFLNYVKDIRDRFVCGNLVGLVSCNILDGMAFV